MKFSLFFFSSGEDPSSKDKYRLVIEGAKYADQNGFSSVWIPERHFSAMGCLYPSPQLLLAALARETQHLRLCAGSVSLPLHNPIQIAEEWAMLDNLSGGRAGIACASGWHPNDFVFLPQKYHNRKEQMYEDIKILRKLWQGESIWCEGGDGIQVEVKTYPTPIQPHLPLWIAAGVSPTTFVKAGEIGANLLTHMQIHDPDELAGKIKLYHESLEKHGYDPQAHEITVWVQAFVGENAEVVLQQAATALNGWYKSDAALMFSGFAFLHKGKRIDITQLSATDFEDYVHFICNRLVARNMAIFGTPETCLESIEKFKAIGVTEVGCQVDFGLAPDLALQSLPYLKELKDKFNSLHLTEHSPTQVRFDKAGELTDGSLADTIYLRKNSIPFKRKGKLQDIRFEALEELERGEFYKKYHELGLEYGSSFQGVERIWRRDGEVLGWVGLPEAIAQQSDLYSSHPAFIDSCVQILLAGLPGDAVYNPGVLYFAGIRSFRIYSELPKQVWCHAILRSETSQTKDIDKLEGDVTILDEDGQVLAEIVGLRIRYLERDTQSQTQQNLSISIPNSDLNSHTDRYSDWLYEMKWQPDENRHNSLTTYQRGGWLIFTDTSGVGENLKSLLEANDQTCIIVFSGENYKLLETGHFQVNPTRKEDFQQLLEEVSLPAGVPLRGVVHLWSLKAASAQKTTLASLEAAQKLGCGSVLSLVQALTMGSRRNAIRLWLVTCGTQAVTTEAECLSVTQSPLWGLGKTINHEYPELLCTTVDLSGMVSQEEIQSLFQEFWVNERESHIALRSNQRYVARLVRWLPEPTQAKRLELFQEGTYLITGGLGSLGLQVAGWMVKQGVRNVVLMGRSEVSTKAREVIDQLEEKGAQVVICKADVSVQEDVARVLEMVKATMAPLRGIFHVAGVLDDGILEQQNWERLQRVMAPKVQGSWNLHILTQDLPLDFFVCFSSVASLLGSPGQGNYAAANAFMDALVHHRRGLGQQGLSINWGLWAESGMAASLGSRVHSRITAQGVEAIAPEQGLQVLEKLLGHGCTQVGVLPVDWSKFVQQFPDGGIPSLLADLAHRPSQQLLKSDQPTAEKNDLLRQLQNTTKGDRHALLTTYTQKLVAKVLRLGTSQIDVQQPLINLGVDSFMSVELKNAIKNNINVDVPIVEFLKGISVAKLVVLLDEQLTEVSSTPNQGRHEAVQEINNGHRVEGEL